MGAGDSVRNPMVLRPVQNTPYVQAVGKNRVLRRRVIWPGLGLSGIGSPGDGSDIEGGIGVTPELFWPLDELVGPIVTDTEQGIQLTDAGGTTKPIYGGPSIFLGGTSVRYPGGTDAQHASTDTSIMNPGTQSFAFQWAMRTDETDGQIFAKRGASGDYYEVVLSGGGETLTFTVFDASGPTTVTTSIQVEEEEDDVYCAIFDQTAMQMELSSSEESDTAAFGAGISIGTTAFFTLGASFANCAEITRMDWFAAFLGTVPP